MSTRTVRLQFRKGERVAPQETELALEPRSGATRPVNQLATAWGELPVAMRVLAIVGAEDDGGWLQEVFAYDRGSQVQLFEAVGIFEALTRLRNECFDAVLINHDFQSLNALAVLDAIRTGSSERQPIVVLGEAPERELGPFCLEAGADAYLCLENTTARMLLWHVARARERNRLIEENRQLVRAKRNHRAKERQEASHLLDEQRELLELLPEPISEPMPGNAAPETLVRI